MKSGAGRYVWPRDLAMALYAGLAVGFLCGFLTGAAWVAIRWLA